MTTSIMPEPRQRYYTNSGAPAAGCKLYTYSAGTTTPKATYTDAAGLVPHQNPITLDVKGEALIYWSGNYKVDLKTAAGVQITNFPVDNFESVDNKIANAVSASDAQLRADLAESSGAEGVGTQSQGVGAAPRTVQQVIDVLPVYPSSFAIGGADDTVQVQAAINRAIAANKPLNIDAAYIASTLTVAGKLTIVGAGSITKKANTFGHLLDVAGDLMIRGNIFLDQNAANNVNVGATSGSDCTINHVGETLILDYTTFAASVSANIKSTATKKFHLNQCDVDGGWMNVYAPVGVACKVSILGGSYLNARKDDGIQVHNSRNPVIDRAEAGFAFRSGIVVSGAAGNARITKNYSHDNKIEVATTQGGWGIVCSVSTDRTVLLGNICVNNERGPMTIDTYTTGTPSYTDAHVIVANNILDGDYNGAYSTTGLGLNGCRFATATGNRIRRVAQGILAVDVFSLEIGLNTIEDISTGYFIQALRCENAAIAANEMRLSGNASGGVLNVLQSSKVRIKGNNFYDLAGAGRTLFKLTDVADFEISGNTAVKTDVGTGFMVWLNGVCPVGRISANKFRSAVNAWQYYINGTGATLTDVVTEHNEITVPSVQTNPNRYILAAPLIVSDGDTLNGVRDYYSAAPTFCAVRQGQTAGIAGALKLWNGAAWA